MKSLDPACRRLQRSALAVAGAFFVFSSTPGISAAETVPAPAKADKSSGTADALNMDWRGSYGRARGDRANLAIQTAQTELPPADSRVNPNHDYVINLRVAPWLAQPGGNATLGSLGTEVDLQDDLGIDDYDVHPSGSANLRLGRHDIWIDALVIDISASDVVQRTITFGSLTVPVNRSVRSDIELQLYDFRYGYSFFDLKQDGFRLGPTLGVAYLDFDVKVTDQVAGTSDSFSESVPIPRIGLQGSVPFGSFDFAAKFSGLYVEFGDFEGYSIEGDVSVAWRPLRNFGLVGGYPAISTDIEFKSDNFNLTFQGPYFGAELRF